MLHCLVYKRFFITVNMTSTACVFVLTDHLFAIISNCEDELR